MLKFNPFTSNFDIISDGATPTVLGSIELNTDIGGTAVAPQVVNLHLAGDTAINHKLTSVTDPTNPQDAATMAWVLSQLTTTDAEMPVAYASTTALAANTYSNGTSGVGATLTATTNGFLIIDGVTTSVTYVGQRVLIAGEATQANNGIYTITSAGSLIAKYVLTRATDYDQAAEIESGDLFAVAAPTGLSVGSANNGKVFVTLAPTPFTVGTSSLNFSSVGSTYSAGTALGLSGTTFNVQADGTSIDVNGSNQLRRMAVTGDIAVPTGGGTATLPNVNANTGTFGDATHVAVPTVNAKGQITAMTTATIAVVAATQRTFSYFTQG